MASKPTIKPTPKTLKDFCDSLQKSVQFYKMDFFFVRREGNIKTLMLVQRSLPALRMNVVGNDIEIESTYNKAVPDNERARSRNTRLRIGGNAGPLLRTDPGPFDWDTSHVDEGEDGGEDLSPQVGFVETSRFQERILAHTFAKLSGVRVATLFGYGFEFVCDSGLDLYAVECASQQDSSSGNLIHMCGKQIRALPLRPQADQRVISTWAREDANEFIVKMKKKQRQDQAALPMGQSLRKIDVNEVEIV